MAEALLVVTVDGNSYIVEPRGGTDLASQARRITEQGATTKFSDGRWAVIPAHQVARVELYEIDDS